jgi:hypothetical protein
LSKPKDRDPVLMLLMLGGCSVIVAIIFYFAWTWFLTVMR